MYALRSAEEADRSWLIDLRRDVYRELYLATFGVLDEHRNQRHSDECWERGPIWIIQLDGQDVGMVQLAETKSAICLEEIQIGPAHQRKGLGAAILKDILDKAASSARTVTLYTGLKNHGARRLYERLGFQMIGRSETHTHMEFVPRSR
jgi:GNAT superfamily N-acetyltransferase